MSRRVGVSAYIVKAHMPTNIVDSVEAMQSIAEILSDNITALMEDRKITSDAALAKIAHVDQKTIWRIRHKEQSPTVDKVECIARAFGLHAWQMLIPLLDPHNPPVYAMSDTERDFYAKMTDMAREFAAHQTPKKYSKQ
jgi:transcriptional regulator with XRE-family HTH domain